MPQKTMTVRVNPDATVAYEGCRRRRLPHGEAVTVPCTSYYLRLLHQGSIVRDDVKSVAPAVTTAKAAGKEGSK